MEGPFQSSCRKSGKRSGEMGNTGRISGGGRLTHSVEEGDTMWGLAVRYDVSIEQIMQLNSKENSLLSIDEVLVIRPE